MIICPKCKRENADDYIFCMFCGAELAPARGGVAPSSPSPGDLPLGRMEDLNPEAAFFGSAPGTAAAPKVQVGEIPVSPGPALGAKPIIQPRPAVAMSADASKPIIAPKPVIQPKPMAQSVPNPATAMAIPPIKDMSLAKKICQQCGAEVPTSFKFCGECGAKYEPPKPKPRLTVINPDGSEGKFIELAKPSQSLGRGECDIRFEDDRYLSPKHATLTADDAAHVVIRDEGSLNGVFVRIHQPVEIQPGDYFQIGRQLLKYESHNDFERLPLERAPDDDADFYGSPAGDVFGRLVQVVEGGRQGEIYLLRAPETTLGRENQMISFNTDSYMSARHAQLRREGNKLMLIDQGSSNGTYIRVRKEQELKPGDLLLAGTQVLKFDIVKP